MDCGPSCLHMICRHHGKHVSMQKLRELSELGKEGVNLLGISDAAEKVGFHTLSAQLAFKKLKEEALLPAIVHWGQKHFVVVYKIKKNNVYVADPAKGLLSLTRQEFCSKWISDKRNDEETGVVLLLEPGTDFTESNAEDDPADGDGHFSTILKYVKPYKQYLWQLFLGVLLGSGLQLILPFLTQSIVDIGINTGNLHFVYVVLFAQLALFAGRLTVEFIRGWILFHISSRINISILTDFIIKLMKLPVSFFDSKKTGDILQRMNDHQRIQSFLTGTSLNTLFSLFNLIIFSVVLLVFNAAIFSVFFVASIFYALWIVLFLGKRKNLDYKQFDVAASEQSKTIQLIQGMQEIKLQGCERSTRWEWEKLQAGLFRLGMKGLSLNQWQQAGAFFINEGKNILITFLAAKTVVDGQMTLGAMLAVQYIIGQLNSPVEQMINFVQNWQLAKISLDRLNEVHAMEDEERPSVELSAELPSNKTIEVSNVNFVYPGAGNEHVLRDISLTIPEGKTTAIVGTSGSGKTTLLKILLKFYDPSKGDIKVGGNNLQNISHRAWRSHCGVVMQDSFIFSDTIAKNITAGAERVNSNQLKHAAEAANIKEFIESLPLGYNTKIGAEGSGISAGQRQRILIARAVYKNPDYIFFDEATNALDANNERTILENLFEFFRGKTVVVVAHRLSTVRNADQIVVLNKGQIIEAGDHRLLTSRQGEYFSLVKNQLELGS
jgi:ATP-binding cassette, subfamily B, bacterial